LTRRLHRTLRLGIARSHPYFTWCVQCHGPNADGRSRFGEYAKDLRQFSRGYSVFFATVVAGRPEKKMPPWGEYLSPEDIQRIGAYLETLAIAGATGRTRGGGVL